ncbi:TraC family protein, partial [Candidatus Peregrinibacteria bacterium]|nr:TraC family protein [Candidatus Peregrinibacteria bacterium]
FVNTINFPLQVVISSTKMNIDPYLDQLRTIAEKQENALLKEQTVAYADFIEKLVDIADIMQKRFYVVVPFDLQERKKNLVEQFLGWMQQDDSASKALQRNREFSAGGKALKDRVNLVQAGLENIGLMSKRLQTHELIELFYHIYNPRTSQEQKLPQEESALKLARNVL